MASVFYSQPIITLAADVKSYPNFRNCRMTGARCCVAAGNRKAGFADAVLLPAWEPAAAVAVPVRCAVFRWNADVPADDPLWKRGVSRGQPPDVVWSWAARRVYRRLLAWAGNRYRR